MNQKKLPGGVRALLAFLSVILCIVLFFSTITLIVVTDVRVITSKGGLKTIISQVMFPDRAPSRPVHSPLAIGRPAPSDSDFNLQGGLVDSLYSMLEQQFGGELPVSKEQVNEFISNSTVPEFLTDKAASLVNDMYTGENTTTITKDEVMELITENKTLIEDALGVTIQDEDIQQIGQYIEETNVMESVQEQFSQIVGITPPADTDDSTGGSSSGDTSLNKPSVIKPSGSQVIEGILSGEVNIDELQIAEILAIVRDATSVSVLLTLIGVCLVLIALLLLTHWGRPFAAVRSAGIPILLAGLFMTLPAALSGVLSGMAGDAAAQMTMMVVKQILSMTGYVSLSFAGLGLVMIVVGAILNGKMKKRAARPAVAAAEPVASVPVAVAAPAAEVLSQAVLAEDVPVEEVPAEEVPAEPADPAEESAPEQE